MRRAPISAEDLWLLRIFVLLRAEKEQVSEASLHQEFERRQVGESSVAGTRRLLQSLVRKGYIRKIDGQKRVFAVTSLGKKAALQYRGRLSELKGLLL